jgi:hypothetical protein
MAGSRDADYETVRVAIDTHGEQNAAFPDDKDMEVGSMFLLLLCSSFGGGIDLFLMLFFAPLLLTPFVCLCCSLFLVFFFAVWQIEGNLVNSNARPQTLSLSLFFLLCSITLFAHLVFVDPPSIFLLSSPIKKKTIKKLRNRRPANRFEEHEGKKKSKSEAIVLLDGSFYPLSQTSLTRTHANVPTGQADG